MHPSHLTFDRTLPSEREIRPALTDANLTTLDGPVHTDRVHRVLYPVFRVEYTYEDDSGLIGTDTERGVALVDGLWAGNDAALTAYADGLEDPVDVPFDELDVGVDRDGFGQTIMLTFQAPDESARRLLPQRFGTAEGDTTATATPVDSQQYLDSVREAFAIPDAVDANSFEGVESVERFFLPFWLVQFRAERSGHTALVTVRDSEEIRRERTNAHDWLTGFVEREPTRLAEYGYRVNPTSESTEETDRPERAQPVGADDEITQPDDVDMDAESLVETDPGRSFEDVGGMSSLKKTLEETILAPIEQPERFEEYGLDPVHGLLLHGPPGCGKTYMAGALAGELWHYFIEVTPADVTSRYMGQPAQNVEELFAIARANQPCVLFIDELDALAGSRSDDMNTSEQQAVNQFLTELEAVAEEDIVVVGATNLVEDIDPAIRRSGRFDERVEVPPPDADARRAILQLHLAERPTVADLSYDEAVEATAGYAASDLERVAEETARNALQDDSEITTEHLSDALEGTKSSIDEWLGEYRVDGRTVTQPEDVDLNARSLVVPEPARSFADVGGMAKLKETLDSRVIEPLANPGRFEEYGIDVLSGLLLYGPPGCGKTYLTEALAGELGHYFIEVTPADVTSKWMGQPAQNVADLFDVAHANQPCILFIDELDALAGSRSGGMNTSERQLVNQLLTELEAVAEEDVVVVGATNLVEDIDGAIQRSGRFDERIEVPPPDADARRAILQVHLAETPTVEAIDWERVVEATAGFAASDLELLAETAARYALAEDSPVAASHLVRASEDVDSSLAHWDQRDRYVQSSATSAEL